MQWSKSKTEEDMRISKVFQETLTDAIVSSRLFFAEDVVIERKTRLQQDEDSLSSRRKERRKLDGWKQDAAENNEKTKEDEKNGMNEDEDDNTGLIYTVDKNDSIGANANDNEEKLHRMKEKPVRSLQEIVTRLPGYRGDVIEKNNKREKEFPFGFLTLSQVDNHVKNLYDKQKLTDKNDIELVASAELVKELVQSTEIAKGMTPYVVDDFNFLGGGSTANLRPRHPISLKHERMYFSPNWEEGLSEFFSVLFKAVGGITGEEAHFITFEMLQQEEEYDKGVSNLNRSSIVIPTGSDTSTDGYGANDIVTARFDAKRASGGDWDAGGDHGGTKVSSPAKPFPNPDAHNPNPYYIVVDDDHDPAASYPTSSGQDDRMQGEGKSQGQRKTDRRKSMVEKACSLFDGTLDEFEDHGLDDFDHEPDYEHEPVSLDVAGKFLEVLYLLLMSGDIHIQREILFGNRLPVEILNMIDPVIAGMSAVQMRNAGKHNADKSSPSAANEANDTIVNGIDQRTIDEQSIKPNLYILEKGGYDYRKDPNDPDEFLPENMIGSGTTDPADYEPDSDSPDGIKMRDSKTRSKSPLESYVEPIRQDRRVSRRRSSLMQFDRTRKGLGGAAGMGGAAAKVPMDASTSRIREFRSSRLSRRRSRVERDDEGDDGREGMHSRTHPPATDSLTESSTVESIAVESMAHKSIPLSVAVSDAGEAVTDRSIEDAVTHTARVEEGTEHRVAVQTVKSQPRPDYVKPTVDTMKPAAPLATQRKTYRAASREKTTRQATAEQRQSTPEKVSRQRRTEQLGRQCTAKKTVSTGSAGKGKTQGSTQRSGSSQKLVTIRDDESKQVSQRCSKRKRQRSGSRAKVTQSSSKSSSSGKVTRQVRREEVSTKATGDEMGTSMSIGKSRPLSEMGKSRPISETGKSISVNSGEGNKIRSKASVKKMRPSSRSVKVVHSHSTGYDGIITYRSSMLVANQSKNKLHELDRSGKATSKMTRAFDRSSKKSHELDGSSKAKSRELNQSTKTKVHERDPTYGKFYELDRSVPYRFFQEPGTHDGEPRVSKDAAPSQGPKRTPQGDLETPGTDSRIPPDVEAVFAGRLQSSKRVDTSKVSDTVSTRSAKIEANNRQDRGRFLKNLQNRIEKGKTKAMERVFLSAIDVERQQFGVESQEESSILKNPSFLQSSVSDSILVDHELLACLFSSNDESPQTRCKLLYRLLVRFLEIQQPSGGSLFIFNELNESLIKVGKKIGIHVPDFPVFVRGDFQDRQNAFLENQLLRVIYEIEQPSLDKVCGLPNSDTGRSWKPISSYMFLILGSNTGNKKIVSKDQINQMLSFFLGKVVSKCKIPIEQIIRLKKMLLGNYESRSLSQKSYVPESRSLSQYSPPSRYSRVSIRSSQKNKPAALRPSTNRQPPKEIRKANLTTSQVGQKTSQPTHDTSQPSQQTIIVFYGESSEDDRPVIFYGESNEEEEELVEDEGDGGGEEDREDEGEEEEYAEEEEGDLEEEEGDFEEEEGDLDGEEGALDGEEGEAYEDDHRMVAPRVTSISEENELAEFSVEEEDDYRPQPEGIRGEREHIHDHDSRDNRFQNRSDELQLRTEFETWDKYDEESLLREKGEPLLFKNYNKDGSIPTFSAEITDYLKHGGFDITTLFQANSRSNFEKKLNSGLNRGGYDLSDDEYSKMMKEYHEQYAVEDIEYTKEKVEILRLKIVEMFHDLKLHGHHTQHNQISENANPIKLRLLYFAKAFSKVIEYIGTYYTKEKNNEDSDDINFSSGKSSSNSSSNFVSGNNVNSTSAGGVEPLNRQKTPPLDIEKWYATLCPIILLSDFAETDLDNLLEELLEQKSGQKFLDIVLNQDYSNLKKMIKSCEQSEEAHLHKLKFMHKKLPKLEDRIIHFYRGSSKAKPKKVEDEKKPVGIGKLQYETFHLLSLYVNYSAGFLDSNVGKYQRVKSVLRKLITDPITGIGILLRRECFNALKRLAIPRPIIPRIKEKKDRDGNDIRMKTNHNDNESSPKDKVLFEKPLLKHRPRLDFMPFHTTRKNQLLFEDWKLDLDRLERENERNVSLLEWIEGTNLKFKKERRKTNSCIYKQNRLRKIKTFMTQKAMGKASQLEIHHQVAAEKVANKKSGKHSPHYREISRTESMDHIQQHKKVVCFGKTYRKEIKTNQKEIQKWLTTIETPSHRVANLDAFDKKSAENRKKQGRGSTSTSTSSRKGSPGGKRGGVSPGNKTDIKTQTRGCKNHHVEDRPILDVEWLIEAEKLRRSEPKLLGIYKNFIELGQKEKEDGVPEGMREVSPDDGYDSEVEYDDAEGAAVNGYVNENALGASGSHFDATKGILMRSNNAIKKPASSKESQNALRQYLKVIETLHGFETEEEAESPKRRDSEMSRISRGDSGALSGLGLSTPSMSDQARGSMTEAGLSFVSKISSAKTGSGIVPFEGPAEERPPRAFGAPKKGKGKRTPSEIATGGDVDCELPGGRAARPKRQKSLHVEDLVAHYTGKRHRPSLEGHVHDGKKTAGSMRSSQYSTVSSETPKPSSYFRRGKANENKSVVLGFHHLGAGELMYQPHVDHPRLLGASGNPRLGTSGNLNVGAHLGTASGNHIHAHDLHATQDSHHPQHILHQQKPREQADTVERHLPDATIPVGSQVETFSGSAQTLAGSQQNLPNLMEHNAGGVSSSQQLPYYAQDNFRGSTAQKGAPPYSLRDFNFASFTSEGEETRQSDANSTANRNSAAPGSSIENRTSAAQRDLQNYGRLPSYNVLEDLAAEVGVLKDVAKEVHDSDVPIVDEEKEDVVDHKEGKAVDQHLDVGTAMGQHLDVDEHVAFVADEKTVSQGQEEAVEQHQDEEPIEERQDSLVQVGEQVVQQGKEEGAGDTTQYGPPVPAMQGTSAAFEEVEGQMSDEGGKCPQPASRQSAQVQPTQDAYTQEDHDGEEEILSYQDEETSQTIPSQVDGFSGSCPGEPPPSAVERIPVLDTSQESHDGILDLDVLQIEGSQLDGSQLETSQEHVVQEQIDQEQFVQERFVQGGKQTGSRTGGTMQDLQEPFAREVEQQSDALKQTEETEESLPEEQEDVFDEDLKASDETESPVEQGAFMAHASFLQSVQDGNAVEDDNSRQPLQNVRKSVQSAQDYTNYSQSRQSVQYIRDEIAQRRSMRRQSMQAVQEANGRRRYVQSVREELGERQSVQGQKAQENADTFSVYIGRDDETDEGSEMDLT